MPEPENITRPVAARLDEVIGRRFDVLDDGFVRVIDYMGSDAAIVQAARVSYGDGTKSVSDDRTLIRYLLRHRHTTPFEMCEIKLHVRVPMDTWRQWIRHRTASVNEYSTRYSIAIDSMAKTVPSEWRMQDAVNRQGSAGFLEIGAALTQEEGDFHAKARKLYERRLAAGVAREQARKDLPLSTYTEAYWKIDLHNLFHFVGLRIAESAQSEIQRYAATIGDEIVARWCPIAWEAFLDYRRDSVSLSRQERQLMKMLISGLVAEARSAAVQFGFARTTQGTFQLLREGREFEAKLEGLGVTLLTAAS